MHQLVSQIPAAFGKCLCSCKNAFISRGSAERSFWSGKYDFLLSMIGSQIGLGNLWSFPFLCYANGGLSFLISYSVMMMFIGLPIIFMEMAFGQYTNMGPVHGWKSCPIMTGVGWAMLSLSGISCIYYNALIAWCLYYTIAPVATNQLPWKDCKNPWNDNLCLEDWTRIAGMPAGQRPCTPTQTVNCTRFESPSEQYYERVVFGFVDYSGVQRKMTDPLGKLQWHTALCLLLCWIFVFICMLRGVRTGGKVVYFTATFPLLLLLVLLVRAVTLPGAAAGLKVLLTPNFAKLLESSVWIAATTQVLFSLGGGNGVVINLASFNRLNHNCYRDAIIVCMMDMAVAIAASLAVFSVIGYVADRNGQPVRADQGARGFASVVFAEAATSMPGGQAWCVVFFLLLVLLGIDSQFLNLENPTTAMLDQWPSLRQSIWKETALKSAACISLFLLGLPLCCHGGIFVFDVYYNFSAYYSQYVVVLCEIAAVCCFYGLENFLNDIQKMLGFRPGFYWTACWTVLIPLSLLVMLIIGLITYKRPTVGDGTETMSDWGEALGWVMVMIPILCILGFAVMWRPSLASRPASDRLENRLLKVIAMASTAGRRRRVRPGREQRTPEAAAEQDEDENARVDSNVMQIAAETTGNDPDAVALDSHEFNAFIDRDTNSDDS